MVVEKNVVRKAFFFRRRLLGMMVLMLAVTTRTSPLVAVTSALTHARRYGSLAFSILPPTRAHPLLAASRICSSSAKRLTSSPSANSRRGVSGCEPWGWVRGTGFHTSLFRLGAAWQVWMCVCVHTNFSSPLLPLLFLFSSPSCAPPRPPLPPAHRITLTVRVT